jgi:hypothetical protein
MVLESFENHNKIPIKHNIDHKIYQLTLAFIGWLIVLPEIYTYLPHLTHSCIIR